MIYLRSSFAAKIKISSKTPKNKKCQDQYEKVPI